MYSGVDGGWFGSFAVWGPRTAAYAALAADGGAYSSASDWFFRWCSTDSARSARRAPGRICSGGILGHARGADQQWRHELRPQAIGIVAIGAFTFLASLVVRAVIKATVGIRIAEEDEEAGIDQVELGMEAYPEFGPGLAQ